MTPHPQRSTLEQIQKEATLFGSKWNLDEYQISDLIFYSQVLYRKAIEEAIGVIDPKILALINYVEDVEDTLKRLLP